MPDYADYYRRTIEKHKTDFQLVLGGTGLGKTSRIRKVIATPEYQDRKFIYCANRKQLLEEMAQELDSFCYVVLRRDLEVVLHTLKEQNEAFYELLSAPIFTRSVQSMIPSFERIWSLGSQQLPIFLDLCITSISTGSNETIRQLLKKMTSNPGNTSTGVFPT